MKLLKFMILGFLGLLISCSQTKEVPIDLSNKYIVENKKRLELFEEEIERLKSKEKYMTNLVFQKRVERAEEFYYSASQEFKELIENQNKKNKREFEMQLRNYKTVWGYIVTNYSI